MLEFLNNMSDILSNNLWVSPFICLIAGFLAALMPCSLSQLPLLIAYLGGYQEKGKSKAIKYSIFYVLGNTLVFVALGIVSAMLGKSFSFLSKKIYIVFGALMLLMFLQIIGVINIIPQRLSNFKTSKKGALGAFIFGIIGGFFASPCSTPVLIAILSFGVSTKNILLATIMLLFYSIGHGTLLVILGSSLELADKLSNSEKMSSVGKIINIAIGIGILLLGLYMFYLGF